ncbi:MAG: HTH domain-containing protein, partial [Sphaerochaetaceae bacterium]|nr:HTH domain-containing protein [Sphaerochaetaceae bacterium]
NILEDEFSPYPKNPLIANFFTAIGRAEEIGSGVKNLYKYCKIYAEGGKPVLFEDDVFKIDIPLTEEAVIQQNNKYNLTEREEKIKNLVIQNPKITVDGISLSLGVNRRTVLRSLQELKTKMSIIYDRKTGQWTLN